MVYGVLVAGVRMVLVAGVIILGDRVGRWGCYRCCESSYSPSFEVASITSHGSTLVSLCMRDQQVTAFPCEYNVYTDTIHRMQH